jgi:hypothetical protein
VTQPLQVIGRDLSGGLHLDGRFHVVDDEIHLDAAGQTPQSQGCAGLPVLIPRPQFVEDVVLQRLAEEFRSGGSSLLSRSTQRAAGYRKTAGSARFEPLNPAGTEHHSCVHLANQHPGATRTSDRAILRQKPLPRAPTRTPAR